MTRRAKTLAGIFLAALAVRLVYALATSQGTGELVGDSAEYAAYATHWLKEGRYAGAPGWVANRMPGYPFFLAAVYAVFGPSVLAVQLLQCAIGAATCVLIFMIAEDWLEDRSWALVAGLLAAAYFDLLAPSARIATESLTTFLLTFFAWSWCRAGRWDGRRALAGGASLAAGYLIRPELILLPPLFAALAWRRSRRAALLLLLPLALAAAPWALRNARAVGRPVVTTTAGPMNLYLGLPRTIHERLGGLPDFMPVERFGELPAMDERGQMDYFGAQARRLIRQARPAQLARAWAFNLAIEYYPFLPAYDPTVVLLLPFWLWALWLSRRDARAQPMIVSVVVLTGLYSVVAVMQSRHRQILGSFLVLLAVYGLREARRRIGRERFIRLLAGWGGLNLAVWAGAPKARRLALLIRDLI